MLLGIIGRLASGVSESLYLTLHTLLVDNINNNKIIIIIIIITIIIVIVIIRNRTEACTLIRTSVSYAGSV